MTNATLSHILRSIDLSECKPIFINHIYYVEKIVSQNVNGHIYRDKYELLVIVEFNIKKAIILRCGTTDLHWYVFRQYRNQHVLSNALKTGVISEIWPENKTITCHYEIGDTEDKYYLTCHLAKLACLEVR